MCDNASRLRQGRKNLKRFFDNQYDMSDIDIVKTAMTNELKDEIRMVLFYIQFPCFIETKWAKARECKERGIEPEADFDNYYWNFCEEHGTSLEEMEHLMRNDETLHNMYSSGMRELKSL
jgi:hypothetical protein